MNRVSKNWFLKGIMAVVCMAVLFLGVNANAQWLPSSYYYTNPLYYTSYGYSNPISGASTLLGYAPFSPFYDPAYIYSLAGLTTPINIPSYGYPYSPYVTPFPYLTTPGAVSPYVSFSYPYYTYGSPSYYSTWSLLNGATYGLVP
jgi:hypothetical protein